MKKIPLLSKRAHAPWILGFVLGATAATLAFIWMSDGEGANSRAIPFQAGEENADPPVKIKRLFPEWAPQRALVLAMPIHTFFEDQDSFLDILKIAAARMEVLILVPNWGEENRTLVRNYLENHPDLAPHAGRIRFVPSRIGSQWIRDFGPFYGKTAAGELIFLDTRYFNEKNAYEQALERWNAHRFSSAGDTDAGLLRFRAISLGGEVAPADLARFVRNQLDYPVEVVRVPLLLPGGDFLHNGKKTAFVSEATLRDNGSNRERVETRLRQYFGLEHIGYLEVLPGAPHLDFIAQFVDAETILMAELTHEAPPNRLYLKQLYADVERILERNVAIVRRLLPQVRIIRVPLPPPLTDSPEVVNYSIRNKIIALAGRELGIDWKSIQNLPEDNPQRQQVETKIRAHIRIQMGPVDLNTSQGWDRVARHFAKADFAALTQRHVETGLKFRTFLNFLYLNPIDGPALLLIPDYTAQSQAESELLASLKKEALAAYNRAAPGVEQKLIKCDSSIRKEGAIHCFTQVLPDLDRW